MKAESVNLDMTEKTTVESSWFIILGIWFAEVTVSVFIIVPLCCKKKSIRKDDIQANIGKE